MMSRQITYAIDFGTSNSLLAASVDGKCVGPISLDPTNKEPEILRSLIYFPEGGEPSYGIRAIESYTEQSGEGRFIRSVKKHLPSELFRGTQIQDRFYSLEDLVGAFLREMKRRADVHFNQDVTEVVIGRPAKFSMDREKDMLAETRLLKAAQYAGFKNISFFPEPLAAAFDYRQQIESEKMVLIVDLGGGTSDFTVIRLSQEAFRDEDVLALGGLSIAGDAIDGTLMGEKISPHFGSLAEYRLPLGNNVLKMPPALKYQLMSPADIVLMAQKDLMGFLREVRKCVLNSQDESSLDQLFSLVKNNLGFAIYEEIDRVKRTVCSHGQAQIKFIEEDIDLEDQISIGEFEKITEDKISKIFEVMDSTIQESGLRYDQIDMICCTGGTSKIPAVRKELVKRFNEERLNDLNSFQSVIQGLSQRALQLS